jgi:thiosulfate/3-mercaptopyruvate sulfurtransferase
MSWTTLIGADELAHVIDRCIVVDCRFDLANPQAGAAAFAQAHIPSAVFIDMDRQLSAPKSGQNGRHPMPSSDAVRALLESIGLNDDTQLIIYDVGGMASGRLWWMARWIGHEHVAVLDGGLKAWERAGFPVTAEPGAVRPAGRLSARPPLSILVDADTVSAASANASRVLIDARAADRFRGENETIDPVAGHIPGSLNRPWNLNLREDGRFKPAPFLRAEFEAMLDGRHASDVINSCGSGVSACHNILAMTHAGLTGAALYGGSWSEWVANPERPVATGPQA